MEISIPILKVLSNMIKKNCDGAHMNIIGIPPSSIRLELMSQPGSINTSIVSIYNITSTSNNIIISGNINHCIKIGDIKNLFSTLLKEMQKESLCYFYIIDNQMCFSVSIPYIIRVDKYINTIDINNTINGRLKDNKDDIETKMIIKAYGMKLNPMFFMQEKNNSIVMHFQANKLTIYGRYRYVFDSICTIRSEYDHVITMDFDVFSPMWSGLIQENIEESKIENIITKGGDIIVRQTFSPNAKSSLFYSLDIFIPHLLFSLERTKMSFGFNTSADIYMYVVPSSNMTTFITSNTPQTMVDMSATNIKMMYKSSADNMSYITGSPFGVGDHRSIMVEKLMSNQYRLSIINDKKNKVTM